MINRIARSSFVFGLLGFLICSVLTAGLSAADISDLVGTWVGESEIIEKADGRKSGFSPAILDIAKGGESGPEVYLTIACLGQQIKNATYTDGVLTFEFGIPGFLPYMPVKAEVVDGSTMQFEYKIDDTSSSQFARIKLAKKALPVWTDEQISGTYRARLLDPYDWADVDDSARQAYDVVLNINVKGDEASADAKIVVVKPTEDTPLNFRSREFEFHRIERLASRFFLRLRTAEEDVAAYESRKVREPNIHPRFMEVMSDTFHIWMQEDGRFYAMVSSRIGNSEGYLVKDPPKEETGEAKGKSAPKKSGAESKSDAKP